jgi:RNA-directed DNA polymerase
MRRLRVELSQIGERSNLLLATAKAVKGKRQRVDVADFTGNLEKNLSLLSQDIIAQKMPYGHYTEFKINDPKPRLIHAACFPDRVFHHAMMNLVGPKLDSSMSHNSYACRVGKGVHKIAKQVQQNMQRYSYFCKIDIDAYFNAIDQQHLQTVLATRLKGEALLKQCQRIIHSYQSSPNKGLPIGSLTSQYFANLYLDGFDRFLEQNGTVKASLRYMDDVIWWCNSRAEAQQSLAMAEGWLQNRRALTVKSNSQINHCAESVLYCGFRINRGAIRPSRRRLRRFIQSLNEWQGRYHSGDINSLELQSSYAAIASIVANTECREWRQQHIERVGILEV